MFKQMQSTAKVALAAASLVALSANAAVVFTEDFSAAATGVIKQPVIGGATGSVTSGANTWTTASGYSFITSGDGTATTGLTTTVYGPFSIASVAGSTGNYAAVDAAFFNDGPLTTSVSGLVVGNWYELSFKQATAQAVGYTGAFTADWKVSIDGKSMTSATMGTNDAFGAAQTWVFKYTGGSNVLSFLAESSGGMAEPPFVLLDNVSISDTTAPVPEPAMLGLVGIGLAGLALARRKQKRA